MLQPFKAYQPEIPGVLDPAKSTPEIRAIAHTMFYNPAPALNALHAPLLEVLGADDDIVEPATSVAVLEHLRASGHDVTTRVFPGVGHSLLTLNGSTIVGYADNYLEFITAWARAHSRH
jgi:acetyl esterase/lipase